MRSLWAVACAASVSGLLLTLAGGCAGTKSQVKEFNRMEVGEGPREVLSQLIELQKEPGGQRIEAHPVLVSPGKGTYIPDSSEFSSGNLSMSRATGAMHDVQPAVPPLGNPPLSAQTDVQSAKSPPGDPVPPASVAPRFSPAPAPVRKAPPPAAETVKPPAPVPPKKEPATVIAYVKRTEHEKSAPSSDAPVSSPTTIERAPTPVPVPQKNAQPPVTRSVEPPAPAPPIKTPSPVAASIEPPVTSPPEREPATVIASAKPAEPARENKDTAAQASISLTKPPSATPQPAKPAVEDVAGGPDYRIGPEDILHVDVWGNKELTTDAIVRPDGMISLPLIQDVQAEGLTSGELSDRIREKLLAFLKDPTVSVIVKQVNASKFFIIGYVSSPGAYLLRGEITVLQAISLGGGFTPFASPRKLRLVRNDDGKQNVREINYYDIIEKGGEGNVLLKPGDTLVVP